MDHNAIIQRIANEFPNLEVVSPDDGPGAGDHFFFTEAQRAIDPAHRLPFATIVVKDYGEFDNRSQLDRPGIFRLNIGVGSETLRARFGDPSEVNGGDYDYAAIDRLMPHPVYAPQFWICVLNPSAATFESAASLLAEAYNRADKRATTQTRPSKPAAH